MRGRKIRNSYISPIWKDMRSIADIKELSAIHLVDGTDWFWGKGHHV
jgi:hypothetical protein